MTEILTGFEVAYASLIWCHVGHTCPEENLFSGGSRYERFECKQDTVSRLGDGAKNQEICNRDRDHPRVITLAGNKCYCMKYASTASIT